MVVTYIMNELNTIAEIKTYLKGIGSKTSFTRKTIYLEHIRCLNWSETFPWREDQLKVINSFMEKSHKYIVINGTFGSGKTTLLISLLMKGIMTHMFSQKEIFFTAFNLCIKNEIKRKLKGYGIGKGIAVRTFDSLIYELCKKYKFKDGEAFDKAKFSRELPNFEGKRLFCYDLVNKIRKGEETVIDTFNHIKYVFVDECQDLDKPCFKIFRTFFPNAKFIFVGDVFQSVQKEPKESMLWYLQQRKGIDYCIIRMIITPRVPRNILFSIKHALIKFYPEMKETIDGWKSDNTHSDHAIEWKKFYSYKNIYRDILDFCRVYGQDKSMILTFSGAVTVRGALGDIARLRTFLRSNNIEVNTNHKRMDRGKLFLSTANSSKGLERDYVLVMLTFPLEKAFVNFSNDIVMNLITVALSRCKKKVIMYIPAYKDKFSEVLNAYMNCPKPTISLRDNKPLSEYGIADYIEASHTVTEIINLNAIKYETKKIIKGKTKVFYSGKFSNTFSSAQVPILVTEEERIYVGVFMENLITSTWLGKWPEAKGISSFENNPLYSHCFNRLKNIRNKYIGYTRSVCFNYNNTKEIFSGIYYYSQFINLLNHKIYIRISQEKIFGKLQNLWKSMVVEIIKSKPKAANPNNINIQANLQMPFSKGIADTIIKVDRTYGQNQSTRDIIIYEIKASISYNWQDDALTQALIYTLMTASCNATVILINPFKNTIVKLRFNCKKINILRNRFLEDVVTWNCNCFLAKNIDRVKLLEGNKTLISEKYIFVDIKTNKNGKILQASVLKLFSPTKILTVFNLYSSESCEDSKIHRTTRKCCKESTMSSDDILTKLKEIERSKLLSLGKYPFLKTKSIKRTVIGKYFKNENMNTPKDISKFIGYKHHEDNSVFCFGNAYYDNMINILFLSRVYRLI